MEIVNLKNRLEFIKEVAMLEREEWGSNSSKTIEEKVNKIKSNFQNPYFEKLLLIDGSTLIGFISMFEYDMEERKDLSPWYATMYVKKEYRGKGYSKLLNDAILQCAKEKGIEKLYLKTTLKNYYEKFGAIPMGMQGEEQLLYFDLKEAT